MELLVGVLIGMVVVFQMYWNERILRLMFERYYNSVLKDCRWWRDYYISNSVDGEYTIDDAMKIAGEQMNEKDRIIDERDKEIQRLRSKLKA